MIEKILLHVAAFSVALVLTLLLTPVVREMNRRLGMVDKPDARRINKVPIPRGGGLALYIGVTVSFLIFGLIYGESVLAMAQSRFLKLSVLATVTMLIGYADDKFSLNPKLKLLGQLAVAFLVWFWADLGFSDLWPEIPQWVDCALTVFWITGAINAFNLIDGLDGLASGLALIATVGMAGGLLFSGHSQGVVFYCVFAGGLLGFLRYNYNPASVFLGDSGSMFIGFTLAVLPLCSHAPNSFLVSVGVPLLAMGVPIFDTSLAILRRSIRRLLRKEGAEAGNGQVMTADTDHLHHRILRAAGLNQRKAAWTLYVFAIFLVATGLVGVTLESRAAGLWLAALVVAVVVAFRDMARVELFDAGLLLDRVAHAPQGGAGRSLAKFAVSFYLVCDIVILALSFLFCCWVLQIPLTTSSIRKALVIRCVATFGCLVFFRTYVTIWSRAVISNFLRLLFACCLGSLAGTIVIYYLPSIPATKFKAFTVCYAFLPFVMIGMLRVVRSVIRDVFYVIDCRRLSGRKDVSRILVYGTGLRYRAFRRELVRSASANTRMIVGLLDDNILLRNHYIGGCRVMGTLADAPEVINALNVDAVVLAFEATEERIAEIRETLRPCGVKVTRFSFSETQL